MPSTHLPQNIDTDRLAEAAIAILSMTLHENGRVWKSLDWDLMDLLEEKGWIVEARTKAKSVVPLGERLRALTTRHASPGISTPSRDPVARRIRERWAMATLCTGRRAPAPPRDTRRRMSR